MEQKQIIVLNNSVLWTYRIMQIWEETVANFCILPVWTLIAQKFFYHIIIVEATLFCTVLVLVPYQTYQDAFQARKTTQFLPFS